jgi:hypothetical protein
MESTVAQAVQALRSFDGDPESVTEIYLLDEKRVLRGAISAGAAGDGAAGDAAERAGRAPRALLPADLHQNDWPNCSTSTTCTRCRWWMPRAAWWAWCRPTR